MNANCISYLKNLIKIEADFFLASVKLVEIKLLPFAHIEVGEEREPVLLRDSCVLLSALCFNIGRVIISTA